MPLVAIRLDATQTVAGMRNAGWYSFNHRSQDVCIP